MMICIFTTYESYDTTALVSDINSNLPNLLMKKMKLHCLNDNFVINECIVKYHSINVLPIILSLLSLLNHEK